MTVALVADGFGEMHAMLAGLAGKDGGSSEAVDDARNAGEGLTGVAPRPLQIAGELGAKVTDQPHRRRADERRGDRLGGDVFSAVVGDAVGCDRT